MTWLAIDCETTGLDPRVHVPWEVAIVEPDGTEHVWRWRPTDYMLKKADPYALDIGGFRDRAPATSRYADERQAIHAVAELTEGNVLVGSKPSFDMDMLTPSLRIHGLEPGWHHRPVCVATMAYGWLHREARLDHKSDHADVLSLPWRSDELSRACGVEPPDGDERHTALGDARWVARWYAALTGGAA